MPSHRAPSRRARRRRAPAVLAGVVLAVVAGCAAPEVPTLPDSAMPGASTPTAVPPGTPRTVVSLTFDDGNRTQYLARPLLTEHGMNATFYVNSGVVDRADGSTMTWDELRGLAADGDDVGGHTLLHAPLPQLPAAEKRHQICDDRLRLLQEGLNPVSFAYPTGTFDPVSASLLRACGYRTGRTAGDIDLNGPRYAETIPPGDPYETKALPTPPSGPLTLEYMTSAVQRAAAHGGGWLQIVLHQICRPSAPDYDQCMQSEAPVDIGVFTDLLDWLGHDAPPGTTVEPVARVVGAD